MGGFIVPQLPPQLIEALKRPQNAPTGPMAGAMPLNGRPAQTLPGMQFPGPLPTPQPPPTPPIQMGPGGVNMNPQAPMTDASGMAHMPGPTPTKLPAVTDDPAVTGMGAAPKTPDLTSYLNPALSRMNQLGGEFSAADERTRLDPGATKPRLWERLLGGVVGGVTGSADAGKAITDRRAREATRVRNLTLDPIKEEMGSQEKMLPTYKEAGEAAERQGKADLDVSKENRERYSAIKNSDYKDAIAQIQEEVAQGNQDKANNLLDEKQKELEQKKTHDDEWYQMQHALLDLREKAAEKGKDHTSQTMGAETQKANAIRSAAAAFNKAYQAEGFPADPKTPWSDEQHAKLQQLRDQQKEAEQSAEDAYEAKSSELKGAPVEHQDVESWRGQPAAPAQTTEKPAQAAAPTQTNSPAPKESALPTQVGPAGEKPAKTGTGEDGKKYGYFASKKQWLLVPGGK